MSEERIKALGVYFINNKEECEKLNWENKINKMNTLFFSWGKRNVSILGKIMIMKALVILIFTFVASACVVPGKYRKEIESKCFKFIWDDKPDKVKRNTMIGNFEMGSLNMIDIESYFTSLRASWVTFIMSKDKSLIFDNWINSDLIYINDILNENGEISLNLILDKLIHKTNWILEFICKKKAIPNEWYHTLQAQNSIKCVVKFQKNIFIENEKCI